MKQISVRVRAFLRTRTGRGVLVSLLVIVYLLLVWLDAQNYFPSVAVSEYPVSWFYFIGSSVVSLLFLVLGCYIWLYAREQSKVSHVLCAFCLAMMVCFSVETASSFDVQTAVQSRLSCIASLGAYTSLFFVNFLLLLFPKNLLATSPSSASRKKGKAVIQPSHFFRVYLSFFAFSTLVCCGYYLHDFISNAPQEISKMSFSFIFTYSDAFIGLIGVLYLVLFSYRRAATGRERRILRFLVVAIVLSFAPLLIFTVIPTSFHMNAFIDTKATALAFACLPVALVYTVFGYQLLAIDSFFRKSVEVVLSIILLMLTVEPLAYLEWKAFSGSNELLCIIITSGLMTPLSLFVGRFVTRWLFLQGFTAPQLLLHKMVAARSSLDDTPLLSSVAQQIYQAVITCCGTASLLLTLEDEMYSPIFGETSSPFFVQEQERLSSLLQQMLFLPDHDLSLDREHEAVHVLRRAERPMWISEVSPYQKVRFTRYVLPPTAGSGDDALLYPIQVSSTLIAILVLSTREIVPPHESVELNLSILSSILDHLSSFFEQARIQYARERRMKTLTTLTMPPLIHSRLSLQQVASLYVAAGSEATKADVECWSYDSSTQALTRIAHTGGMSVLPPAESFTLIQEKNWRPWYYGGRRTMPGEQRTMDIPPLLQGPSHPFAWLPLETGGERIGIVVLRYHQLSHHFSQHEQSMLEVFAQQCAKSLFRVETLQKQKCALEDRRRREAQLEQAYHLLITQQGSFFLHLNMVLEQKTLVNQEFEQLSACVRQGREVMLAEQRMERLLGKQRAKGGDRQGTIHLQKPSTSSVLVNATVDAALLEILAKATHSFSREQGCSKVVVASAIDPLCCLLSLLLSLKGYQVQICKTREEVMALMRHVALGEDGPHHLLIEAHSLDLDGESLDTIISMDSHSSSRTILLGETDSSGSERHCSLPWYFSTEDVFLSLEG